MTQSPPKGSTSQCHLLQDQDSAYELRWDTVIQSIARLFVFIKDKTLPYFLHVFFLGILPCSQGFFIQSHDYIGAKISFVHNSQKLSERMTELKNYWTIHSNKTFNSLGKTCELNCLYNFAKQWVFRNCGKPRQQYYSPTPGY